MRSRDGAIPKFCSVTKNGIARDSQGQIAPELKCIYRPYAWEPVTAKHKVSFDLEGIGFRQAITHQRSSDHYCKYCSFSILFYGRKLSTPPEAKAVLNSSRPILWTCKVSGTGSAARARAELPSTTSREVPIDGAIPKLWSVTKNGIARDSQGQIAPGLKCIYSSYVWEPVSAKHKVNINLGGMPSDSDWLSSPKELCSLYCSFSYCTGAELGSPTSLPPVPNSP